MKLFGRNKLPVPVVAQTEPFYAEAQRVLGAVTSVHAPPFESIFQGVAFSGSYPDIFEFLCRTNSKVVFDD